MSIFKRVVTRSVFKNMLLAATLLFLIVALGFALWFGVYVFADGPKQSGKDVVVNIPKGTSVREIGSILADAGLIRNDIRFSLLAKISGYSGRLQAGEFRLATGRKVGEVIEDLARAMPVQHPITIVEGLRITEIAVLLEAKGWCEAKRFIELTVDKKFIRSLGFKNIDNLEGYLYPDTYLLTAEMRGARKIISMMVARFFQVWSELIPDTQADVINMEETVILASIVEKETGAAGERSIIAGVFVNRLARGMRLQSDPTVVYGVAEYSGKISKKMLRNPTPYNTYTRHGLPVGAICNPGRAALQAVLKPAETEYLYFVAKNDGSHQFSKSLKEHNRAVRKYQRKKRNKVVK